MFKRLIFDTWNGAIPVAGLFLVLSAFLLIFVRAWRMKPVESDRLAHLPLEDDSTSVRNSANPTDHVR